MVKSIALDTEEFMKDPRNTQDTIYQNPYLDEMLLLTIATDTGEEYLYDLRNETIPDQVKNWMEDPEVMVVIHNASFDTKYIYHNYGITITNIWDTLMCERLLWLGRPSIRCGLEATLKRRYGISLDKSHRKQLANGIVTEDGKQYALSDIKYLLMLQSDQAEDLEKAGIRSPQLIENAFAPLVGLMELNGAPFNIEKYNTFMGEITKLHSDACQLVWDLLGYDYSFNLLDGTVKGGLNLGSQKVALKGLKSKGGIDLPDYKEKTLVKYLYTEKDKKKRAIVQAVLEVKKWSKALTWGYDKMVNQETGCLHFSFNALGAQTSRCSSSNPNGQQIAKEYYTLLTEFDDNGEVTLKSVPSGINMRECFVAPDGWDWISADYSQIELRLYGEIANVPTVIDEYNRTDRKPDLHKQAATIIFKKPLDEITDYERSAGKPVNFGCRTFGGGYMALLGAALNYGMLLEPEEAKSMVYNIRKGDPEGQKWGKEITEQAEIEGCVWTKSGYRRWLSEAKETVCRNSPIQGTAATIMKVGLIMFWNWAIENNMTDDIKLVSVVHDEVNLIARREVSKIVLENLIHNMEVAGGIYMEKIPCKVDGGIGSTWAEVH